MILRQCECVNVMASCIFSGVVGGSCLSGVKSSDSSLLPSVFDVMEVSDSHVVNVSYVVDQELPEQPVSESQHAASLSAHQREHS